MDGGADGWMDRQKASEIFLSFQQSASASESILSSSPTPASFPMSPRHFDLGSKSCLLGKSLSFSCRVPTRCPSLSPSPAAKAFLVALGLKFTTVLSFPLREQATEFGSVHLSGQPPGAAHLQAGRDL